MAGNGKAVLGTLAKVLRHPKSSIRRKAMAGILFALYSESAEEWVKEAILQASRDDDPAVRSEAVSCLARIDKVAAIDLLIESLRDSDQNVRLRAAFTHDIDDSRYLDALVPITQDRDEQVRWAALQTLARHRPNDPVVAKALPEAIEKVGANNPMTAGSAASVLVACRTPDAIEALARALRAAGPCIMFILLSLATTSVPELRDEVLLIARSDSRERSLAMYLLHKDHDPEGFEIAVSCLEDPDPMTRQTAVLQLAERGDPRAIPGLREFAQGDGGIARNAKELLKKFE